MTTKASGIDVSSWQHPGGRAIDWEKVAEDGYTFAMIKATQGDTYTSEYFAEDVVAAHKAGLIVGAYLFYVPGVNMQEQAQRFIGACTGHVLELGAWLDWEPGELDQWAATSDYNALVAAIEEARKPVGLYCDLSWYAKMVEYKLVIKRLWIANPSGAQIPPAAMIEQGATESVPGIIGQVDIDHLLNVRGIDIPRPPKAAELPFVQPAEEEPVESTEDEAKGDEGDQHGAPPVAESTST